MLITQVIFPFQEHAGRRGAALWIGNGLFISAGIFANLAIEEIGIDLYVVALLAVLSIFLLWRRGWQPMFVYYASAYGFGIAATLLYRTLV